MMMAVDEPTGQHVATITTDQIQAQVQQTDMMQNARQQQESDRCPATAWRPPGAGWPSRPSRTGAASASQTSAPFCPWTSPAPE